MTTNNNSIHPQLSKFTGKIFDNWCIQMRVLFRSQDLQDLVNIGYNKVTDSKEFEVLSNEQKDSLKDERKIKKHFMQSSKQWMNPYLRKSQR